ncbi:MAG: hypothetical protein LBT33_00030, partial [Spirochaetia bacterium]|nr:hypothetical protein [Spirochaetia bacterium]
MKNEEWGMKNEERGTRNWARFFCEAKKTGLSAPIIFAADGKKGFPLQSLARRNHRPHRQARNSSPLIPNFSPPPVRLRPRGQWFSSPAGSCQKNFKNRHVFSPFLQANP